MDDLVFVPLSAPSPFVLLVLWYLSTYFKLGFKCIPVSPALLMSYTICNVLHK